MLSFKIKKLGNYWYPDIQHEANNIFTFDESNLLAIPMDEINFILFLKQYLMISLN